MSTMMLRELLSEYESMIGTSRSDIGLGARGELNAIATAAKAMVRINARLRLLPNVSWSEQELRDADMVDAVMQSIAKDAP